jgi:hypothetical protein
VKLPHVDVRRLELLPQLDAACGHHHVGRARGRGGPAVDIRIVEEPDVVQHDALLGRRFAAQHLRPIGDARMLLRRDRVGIGSSPVLVGT